MILEQQLEWRGGGQGEKMLPELREAPGAVATRPDSDPDSVRWQRFRDETICWVSCGETALWLLLHPSPGPELSLLLWPLGMGTSAMPLPTA